MDTKEVAAILQVSESWVKRLACKLGVMVAAAQVWAGETE